MKQKENLWLALLFMVQTDCISHAFFFYCILPFAGCGTDVLHLFIVCLQVDYNEGQVCTPPVSEYFAGVSNGPCFEMSRPLSWCR